MDGISGAASVITIFSLALSSTQVIYNTVRGIKNAPKVIQHMISSLQDLSNLLKQLRGFTDRLYLAADLRGLVAKCAADLKEFEEKLAKLSPPANNKPVRLWKNIKATLQERDLVKMSGLIQRHIAALSLQIQIIEGTRGSSHTMSLERVEALSQTQIVLSTKSSNTLESTKTAVDQLNDNVRALETTANTSQQDACLALEQLSNKMQHLSGLPTAQSELSATCNAILELLKQQLPAKPQISAAKTLQDEAVPPRAAETFEEMELEGKSHDSSDDDDDLLCALDRLRQLAKENEKTMFSEEAEAIIHDVQHISELLFEAEEDGSRKERKGKRPRKSYESDMGDDLLYQQEVKRIKGLLAVSHCISINEKASRPLALATAKHMIRGTQCRRRSRYGTVTVRERRKYRTIGGTQQDGTRDAQSTTPEVLEVSLEFLPINPQAPRIAVDFQQRMSYQGSFLSKPVLSVSALLPDDSKIFLLIKDGDLDGLMKSLSLKEAFLTDRDYEGRCLLNYAIHYHQPEICKFLIDKGTNVDFLEPGYGPGCLAWIGDSFAMFSVNEIEEEDPERRALINRCMRLLLEAGADPSSNQLHEGCGCFVDDVLDVGTAESLQMLLDYGLPFVQADSTIEADLWLREILEHGRWTVEMIALLLRRQGKGGLPIQNLNGCLHKALCGSYYADPDELKEALILLIRAGADVYARDSSGCSVSHIACHAKTTWQNSNSTRVQGRLTYVLQSNNDLRLRKIWTEALSACGHEAEEFISATMHLEGWSDGDDDSISDHQEMSDLEESDPEEFDPEESDCSEDVVSSPTRSMCGICKAGGYCEHNNLFCQREFTFSNQYERSLLEGDALIWRTDQIPSGTRFTELS